MKLTPKQEKAALAPLSKRAQKLYKRIRNGAMYSSYKKSVPAALDELFLAGLIVERARPIVFSSFYVPHDYRLSLIEGWGAHTEIAMRSK